MPSAHCLVKTDCETEDFILKKFICGVLVALLMVSLCGCDLLNKVTKTKTPDMNVLFESDANITAGDMKIVSHIKRFGSGYWEMVISEPKTLAGMKITYSDNKVDVSLGDLSFSMEKGNINDEAIFKLLFDAFDHAAVQEEINLTESEDGLMLASQNGDGVYSLTFDKDSRIIKKIELPTYNITAELSNFKLLTETPSETTVAPYTSETASESTLNAMEIMDLPAQEVIASQETIAEKEEQQQDTEFRMWETE